MIERGTKLVDVFTVDGKEYASKREAQIAALAGLLAASGNICWRDAEPKEVAEALFLHRDEVAELLEIAPGRTVQAGEAASDLGGGGL